jgi:hypothetical protein
MDNSFSNRQLQENNSFISLYSPKIRRIQIVISLVLGFLCLLLLRYSQNGNLKILLLYAATVCAMYFVVLYKNSLNRYEIGMFCFLCLQALSIVPEFGNTEPLVAISYLLSYRYGVSSRSFAATIVDFLTNGGFISKYLVWHFIFCTTIFLSFMIVVYLGIVIQKAKDNVKIFLFFLSLLYLSCFTSPTAYFDYTNFGRVEIFALLFMFLFMAIINKPKIRWLIPLLALFTLATHLILVFFYVPFIIVMLFYELLTNWEKEKRTLFLLAVTIIVIFSAFSWYLLFHEKTFVFADAPSLCEYLDKKSDLFLSEHLLHMTLFAKLQDHLDGWNTHVHQIGDRGLPCIIINIPLLFAAIIFWLQCFLRERKKRMKLFFLLPILILLYQVLPFFLFFDFGRWMIMILNVQFMLIFYLIYVNNETVLSVVQAITPRIKQNVFFLILVCLLMAFLGPVGAIGPSHKVLHITKGIFQIWNVLWSM